MPRLPADVVNRLRPMYDGRQVCVTGGAGFIGGHLVDALLSLGASVSVIDDLSNSRSEHLGELIDLEPERVRFVFGSILDEEALHEAVGKSSVVFHLAAMGSVPLSVREPERAFQVNAIGTLRVAEAARRVSSERVVYSSSSSVYGDSPVLPKVESHLPAPVSPYGASKLTGEHVMRSWSASYGLSTVSLRYFNVFGPRQRSDSAYAAVIAAFAAALLKGKPPVIYGDGTQTRDFTFVSNAVLANLQAGVTQTALAGEAVNIGAERRTDINELARLMAGIVGSGDIEPRYEAVRAGDVPHSLADLARARDLLGYEPIVGLEEGLEETIEWYRESAGLPPPNATAHRDGDDR